MRKEELLPPGTACEAGYGPGFSDVCGSYFFFRSRFAEAAKVTDSATSI